MNIIKRTTEFARAISDYYINEDSIVVDATCGNGNDTLYYATKCKLVYGFDIQKEAIDNTEKLLQANNCSNYSLVNRSHEFIKEYVKEADLVMFNLGYLPSGDKSITTTFTSTLKAIENSLEILSKNGAVIIVIYYGHDSGKIEREKVLEYISSLDSKQYHTAYISKPNQHNCPPEIVVITR